MNATPEPSRELIHKVNNLIAVIYTQAAVGRSAPDQAVAELEIIERAAKETDDVVRRVRREGEAAGQ